MDRPVFRQLLAGVAFTALLAPMASAKTVPLPTPKPGVARAQAKTASVPTPVPLPPMSAPDPTPLAPQPAPLAAQPLAPPPPVAAQAPVEEQPTLTASLGSWARSAGAINRDAPLVRTALAQLKKGDLSAATATRDQTRDPATRALIEWLTIRAASRQVGFQRIVAFMRDTPGWPNDPLIRKRAEEALYLEDFPAQTIKSYFGNNQPDSALGRLALARVAAAERNRNEAARLVRTAWREDDLTESLEPKVLSEFGALITPEDHVYRAEKQFFEGNTQAAIRAAARTDSGYQAVARARLAMDRRAPNAGALLDAVPSSARRYAGYQYARIDYLLRANKIEEAAQAMSQVPRDPAALVDTTAWWEKRRWLARDLLDLNDPRTAYQVASQHSATTAVNIADAEFHAGWIALRFLNDPNTAARHFARIAQAGSGPLTRARAGYWQGRAAEARGDRAAAQHFYASAASFHTTYYGQLARAKLGAADLPLRPIPTASATTKLRFNNNPAVHGIELLYAADAENDAIPLYNALISQAKDSESLAMLAQLAERHGDPRAMLMIGKAAVADGHPLEMSAWPTTGIPAYRTVGPSIEKAVVHSIARQESAFNAAAVSRADARGLLQMLPATARKTAQAFGVPFDASRLTRDPAYNATLGAAHLGELVEGYNGSYIMTFAAYNAGASRVSEWMQRYGDPRDPRVDPVDWVERIPFYETRNYVQRVMENVQVYRARFEGGRTPLHIEADLRRGNAGG